MKTPTLAVLLLALSPMPWAGGCIQHKIKADPIEVKPIHITIDVNVRIDRQLNDFFSFEEPSAPKK